MITIPFGLRVLFACTAAISGILVAILGQALWPNLIYPITKRGHKPYHRPLRLWFAFIISIIAAVLCGTIVTVVPSSEPPLPTQVAGVYVTPVGQHQTTTTEPSSTSEGNANCFDTGASVADISWVNENAIATTDGSTIRIWNTSDGILQHTIKAQVGSVTSIAISPDGKRIITAETPFCNGHAVVYEIQSGQIKYDLEASNLCDPISKWVNEVAFSPDGQTFAATANDGGIRIWKMSDGSLSQLLQLPGYGGVAPQFGSAIAYSPDSKVLATGGHDFEKVDHQIRLWDALDGKVLSMFDSIDYVDTMTFSPDGKTLATSGGSGPIRLWEVTGGTLLKTLEGNLDAVLSLSWSPNGKVLASGGADKTVRLWNPSTGEQTLLLKGHTNEVTSVAFSPDGKTLASASWDHEVCLWKTTP